MILDDYDVIILDCDGVIFDSNRLKIDIFRTTLSDFDETLVDKFTEYVKNNFGKSRYHFIQYFIDALLGKKNDEELYNTILRNYSERCVQLYHVAELTVGGLDFLEAYRHKNLYVASGSDELELQSALNDRKLDRFFIEVLGSPRGKAEIISEILNKNDGANALMIGDAKSDFLAAKDNGIDFIYISQYSTANDEMNQLAKNEHFAIFQNLGELI